MPRERIFLLAADLVLLTHVLFVAFVVIGLLLILIGGQRNWRWVRRFWFRLLHLAAIGVVVLQAWLGAICPLTVLEMALRERAGDATYAGSFISHWLETLLYYRAPLWVFAVSYTVFGLVVVGSWWWVRPDGWKRARSSPAHGPVPGIEGPGSSPSALDARPGDATRTTRALRDLKNS